jgi:23S rRNA (guanosine2251-2'-O)-methyltransferase
MDNIIILDNIRSNQNVGSIFRTCDAAGVGEIFLVGLTPSPEDRFGRENKGLTKASLGAEKSVKWEVRENLQDLIIELKKRDYKIVAIEQSEKSVDFRNMKSVLNSKNAFMFGNEVGGIEEENLKLCDEIISIPMKGEKESLNVSVCVGIILYSVI